MNSESPFAHRLHTNYGPSKDELMQIKQYLVDPTNKMLALDNEITRAQAVLDTLCSERDKLSDDINAHLALTSPIRRVPHDILQEIFIACLPSDRNAVMSAREAPILLSQVCGTWREISRATPPLWSSIHISIPPSAINDELAQKRYEAVKIWLGRSGTCPLSISLHYPRVLPNATDSCILIPVMNIIWSLSHRWRHICINMPPSHISNLLSLTESDVPLMESLRLNTIYNFGDSFDWKMLRIFQAPRLTSIFTDFMDRSVAAFPLVNWTNLTELSLYNWSNELTGFAVDDALAILHKCPNLTVCCVAITTPNESDHNIRYPVCLTQLHTLSVVESRHVDASEFFSQLDLPSLRNVVFRTRVFYSDRPVSLLTLMARSTRIENLDFEWPSTIKEDFVRCLSMAPYVVQLRIFIHKIGGWGEDDPTIFDDECLRPFLPTPNNIPRCLCPRLESLKCINASFSDAMLLEFLNSRSGTTHPEVARLQHMHASFDRYAKDEVDVEPFRREGMDISLSYQSLQFHYTALVSPWAGLPADELQNMLKEGLAY